MIRLTFRNVPGRPVYRKLARHERETNRFQLASQPNRTVVSMFRIETLNGKIDAVPLTTVRINIRVSSTTKRGKPFLSTPGPDEHPRSAPFYSKQYCKVA